MHVGLHTEQNSLSSFFARNRDPTLHRWQVRDTNQDNVQHETCHSALRPGLPRVGCASNRTSWPLSRCHSISLSIVYRRRSTQTGSLSPTTLPSRCISVRADSCTKNRSGSCLSPVMLMVIGLVSECRCCGQATSNSSSEGNAVVSRQQVELYKLGDLQPAGITQRHSSSWVQLCFALF